MGYTVIPRAPDGTDAAAYDTETTGLDLRHGARIFAWSSCTPDGAVTVRRTAEPGAPEALRAFWADPRPKVAHNAKFDLTATENFLGGAPGDLAGPGRGYVHDTHKLSHILQNAHADHSLDGLAWELGGYARVDSTIKSIAAELGGFHKVPEHIMRKYQTLDAERCMCLFLFFWPRVSAVPAWRECYEVEQAVTRTTLRMEARGLMIARDRTAALAAEADAAADIAREEVRRIAGRRFNPDSDQQLRRVLYDAPPRGFGLPVLGRTGKTREPALGKRLLLELRERTGHPILDAVLRARSYAKGATVLRGYLTLAGAGGIIHPTLNTCAAITGRQSSENPNLQNVQKSGTEAAADNPYPVRARHAFRPRPEYILLLIDYSGIEMRLLVHYSQEPEMIRCLLEGDGDVHALAAAVYYGDGYTGLLSGPEKKALRNRAKQGAFAQAYGASAQKLAVTLGLSPAAGAAAHARFRTRWPRLAGLSRTIIGWVHERGYVDSVFGRRLHVPRGEAYVGTNYLIQGTAGEILKRAEIRVDAYNRRATGDEVKILLPIHDELILEYPRNRLADLPGYLRDVRRLMTDFPAFGVPLDVEASIATASWERKTPVGIPR